MRTLSLGQGPNDLVADNGRVIRMIIVWLEIHSYVHICAASDAEATPVPMCLHN